MGGAGPWRDCFSVDGGMRSPAIRRWFSSLVLLWIGWATAAEEARQALTLVPRVTHPQTAARRLHTGVRNVLVFRRSLRIGRARRAKSVISDPATCRGRLEGEARRTWFDHSATEQLAAARHSRSARRRKVG